MFECAAPLCLADDKLELNLLTTSGFSGKGDAQENTSPPSNSEEEAAQCKKPCGSSTHTMRDARSFPEGNRDGEGPYL